MGKTLRLERNAVLLVDIENLIGGAASPRPFDIVRFVHAVREHYADLISEFAIARAYANWSERWLRSARDALHIADIDPVQIFRFTGHAENAADGEMIVDAVSIAYERPELDVFVFATGDHVFAPAATKLHELGRTVVGVNAAPAKPSKYLLEVCDLFGAYDNALGIVTPRETSQATARAAPADRPRS